MYRQTSMIAAVVVVLVYLTGSDAIQTTILKPIRSSGVEVGLIFIPGSFMKAEQYNETARAIQEASELRVWVALTGDYFLDMVNGIQVREAVEDAITELDTAGMVSFNYVGVGHGQGGQHLQQYAPNSDLTAVVLLGSTVSRKTELKDFPRPVLTLAAELDGLTRITRVVEEYDKIADDQTSFFKGLYRTPVILIEGTNHAQFASGDMPPQIQSNDLVASITEQQAHEEIGKHVSNFLTVSFSSQDSQIEKALEDLTDAFSKTAQKLQPFLDMRNLDSDGRESMWAVLAQETFAGEYQDRVAVYNSIFENPLFFLMQPDFTKEEDHLIVGTFALVDAEKKSDEVQPKAPMESSREISMKLLSKDAFWKVFDGKNDTALRSEPNTCKSLNQLALYVALGASTQAARDRYVTSGRPIIFEEDAMRGNFLWSPTSFQMWEDNSGLHVKAVAMVTSKLHYCKVLPVYRAMEWINVDSLRPFNARG